LNFFNSFALALPRPAILALEYSSRWRPNSRDCEYRRLPQTRREMLQEKYSHLPQASADGEATPSTRKLSAH
ncbi:MAG TPA: hypothetical protein VEX18_05940, partial [Polyangiaceae bacterium]|nr:hypothetical protein [Polyangiaceae bacterium]